MLRISRKKHVKKQEKNVKENYVHDERSPKVYENYKIVQVSVARGNCYSVSVG